MACRRLGLPVQEQGSDEVVCGRFSPVALIYCSAGGTLSGVFSDTLAVDASAYIGLLLLPHPGDSPALPISPKMVM